MNRFRPQPDRACLEDVSAPVSHFASCQQSHDFMYRQLAQTRHREVRVDPSLWERTASIWAGSATPARASIIQLVANFRGKCTAAAVMVLVVLSVQSLPMPTQHSPAAAGADIPKQTSTTTTSSVAVQSTDTDTHGTIAAATDRATSPVAAASAPTAQPTQQPAASPTPTPTPEPAQPDAEADAPLVSVSVQSGDSQEPLIGVSLPGVSLQVL